MDNRFAKEQALDEVCLTQPVPSNDKQMRGVTVAQSRRRAVRTAKPTPWLAYRRPVPNARIRLFCFHHAGGAASAFRSWAEHLLPYDIELCPVQLPGRETRLREAPYTNMAQLVTQLDKALLPYMDRPTAFFGHSMGATIAFHLAQHLQKRGQPLQRLIISGAPPPQTEGTKQAIHHLPDSSLLNYVQQLNGLPVEVLQNRELLSLLLPTLRADFTLCERAAKRAKKSVPVVLHCPLSVFAGLHDPSITEHELNAWRQHTIGSMRVRKFPGDHFFLYKQPQLVLRAIVQDLFDARANSV